MFCKLARGVFILILISVVIPSTLLAQMSEEEILENTTKNLQPYSIQQKQDEEPNVVVRWLCETFSLLCGGYQTHTVYSPNAKIPQDVSQEDINQLAYEVVEELGEGSVAGTASGEVLAGQSIIDTLRGFFTEDGLFKDEETCVTPCHVLPEGYRKFTAPNTGRVIFGEQVARGALMPQSLQLGDFDVTPTPTLIPGTTPDPNGGTGDPLITGSLRTLIVQASGAFDVPWQVLEAILRIEGDHTFNLSPEEVVQYQQPGAQVPTNCGPNACSAAGPMQFTTGIDSNGSQSCSACGLTQCPKTWFSYDDSVLQIEDDGRTPNVCNLKDAIYAGSHMLKDRSGSADGDTEWSRVEVNKAAQAYYGSCTPCNVAKPGTGAYFACQRLGKTYCDYVWDYYQENLNVAIDPVQPTIPPGSGGGIAQADQLVASIRTECQYGGTPGRVHQLNADCVDSVVPALTSDARSAMKNSAEDYINLQCVGFTRAMRWQFEDSELAGRPTAFNYAGNPPSGYRLVSKGSETPHVRDLLIWNIGSAGHIAYIRQVYDANSVEVMEANWGSTRGVVQSRTVYMSDPTVYGWITLQ
ncbi:CHAP domain-containing protein [Candidatus Roizmanbacteria bacterium]|nr:CHAP domain-containing protein [Candidatus Roizmanbacteria bacterium]